MSLAEASVFVTENTDGSAEFTVGIDDDSHKFSVAADGENAILTYQETCSWRGALRVSEPDESVFKTLMQSDQMTEYLEANDLSTVRREKHD